MTSELKLESRWIPQLIRFHRKKAGLTQAELARMAGISKTVVFDIEKGKQTVQFDTLLKVLPILNITLTLESPLAEAFARSIREKS